MNKWLGAITLVVAACEPGPRPQWLVFIATDAPVPQFGDRLLVQVLDNSGEVACASCERQFAVDDPSVWPLSFGVADDQANLRVRARLFRSTLLGSDGTPTPPSLIDRTVVLPNSASGVLQVGVVLAMNCFGVPSDVQNAMSCDPSTGELASEQTATTTTNLPIVGSWPPAAQVPCSGATEGMVCIPGGAFLLGDPVTPTIGAASAATRPEHIVVLSPFKIDAYEMTVTDYLNLKTQNPTLAEPAAQGTAITDGLQCTYKGSTTAMPLNCVDWSLANTLCAVQGKRLPTEAEWEWVAGNLTSETRYPWGTDSDVCNYAVAALGNSNEPSLCLFSAGNTLPIGPAPGGKMTDVTTLGVYNLAGNLSEWTADEFAAYTDPCWSSGPVLTNPTCMASNSLRTIRGGDWANNTFYADITTREPVAPSVMSAALGLRCASD